MPDQYKYQRNIEPAFTKSQMSCNGHEDRYSDPNPSSVVGGH